MAYKKNENTKRVGIRIPIELDQYYTERSYQTGVSKSALMYFALEDWRKQNETVGVLPDIMKKINQLEKEGKM